MKSELTLKEVLYSAWEWGKRLEVNRQINK